MTADVGRLVKREGLSCVQQSRFSLPFWPLRRRRRAQGTWLETRLIRAICSSAATPVADADRLARRLNLTDPQKAALKELTDASASADASAKKSPLCVDRPDVSTTPGRVALAEKMAETGLPA